MTGLLLRPRPLIRAAAAVRPAALSARLSQPVRFYGSEIPPPSTTNAGKSASESAIAGPQTQGPVLNLDSIFVVSFPITTHRSFLYCHQKSSLLSTKQLNAIPFVLKMEGKLVALATKAWHKLNESTFFVNKQIVYLVHKLLDSIPYNESCLRSFPRKNTMMRELNEDHQELPRVVLTSEVENKTVALDQIKPIPVYHPQFQAPEAILHQMRYFKQSLVGHHTKWAVLCAVGLPLSLPVALIPIVPNVPGLYLAYRLYCHLQALNGAKNLGHLLDTSPEGADGHLAFQGLPALDATYATARASDKEELLMSPETVDSIVQLTGLSEIKEDLHRAFKQEQKRLERARAEGEQREDSEKPADQ